LTVVALIVTLLLPGLAWWAWYGKRGRDPLASLAEVIGISLATVILLAEITFFLKVRFSIFGIVLLLAVFAGLAAAGLVRHGVTLPRRYRWLLIAGGVILGLAVAWRLFQARELLLPNWVDSQHHYLIIRAILEERGLLDTLSPYLDMPFYYHYGFHAVAALFTAVSGLEIGSAMLILGQILNALVGLSVYALGKTLWRDWRPAAAAALLVSFATRMPAYYLSWGRYTLLTGLILLPLAMRAALQMTGKSWQKADVMHLGLLTAGVLLSHYFTAVLLAAFLFLLAIAHFLPRLKRLLTAAVGFSSVIAGTGLGVVLAAPWLLRVMRFSAASASLQSNLPESLGAILEAPETGAYIWKLLGPASNHWLLLVAGIGLVYGFIRRKQLGFGVWILMMAALSLPWTASLRPFRPDHFAIILFLPVTLWAGWAFWRAGCLLHGWLKWKWLPPAVIGLLLGGWIIWSFPLSSDIVNPVTVLVTEDDIEALDWIRENTPEDARFFINTTYWQNDVYRGVDGGGWLLPYTGRWAVVPTVFYGFSPDIEHVSELRNLGKTASEIDGCSSKFRHLIESAGIHWFYIHLDQGALQPDGLLKCENVSIAYQNSKVWIFQITD